MTQKRSEANKTEKQENRFKVYMQRLQFMSCQTIIELVIVPTVQNVIKLFSFIPIKPRDICNIQNKKRSKLIYAG